MPMPGGARARSWLQLAVAAVVLSACADAPTGRDGSVRAAARGGSPANVAEAAPTIFAFVAPLVPSGPPFALFDASARPTVQVCRLVGEQCAGVVATFTRSSAGVFALRVDEGTGRYGATWHTQRSAVNPGADYLVRVLLGGRELGRVPIDVLAHSGQLPKQGFVGVVANRPLEIAFFIGRPRVVVNISPTLASVERGGVLQFSADVSENANRDVVWTTTQPDGFVSSSGEFRAGPTVGTFEVTATSVVNPTRSSTATVLVTDSPATGTLMLDRVEGTAVARTNPTAGNPCTMSAPFATDVPPMTTRDFHVAYCLTESTVAQAMQRYAVGQDGGGYVRVLLAEGSASGEVATENTSGFAEAVATYDMEVAGGDVDVSIRAAVGTGAAVPEWAPRTLAQLRLVRLADDHAVVDLLAGRMTAGAGQPVRQMPELRTVVRLVPGAYRLFVRAMSEPVRRAGDPHQQGGSRYGFTLARTP